jgi:hypothetical protein
MSANLSTIEHYGSGFERTGLPLTPWLNEATQWSKEEFAGQVSQVSQRELPVRLRRETSGFTKSDSNGFSVCPALEVLRAWVLAGRFDGLLMIPDAPFVLPPQHYTVSSEDGMVRIESHPTDPWPRILIELSYSPQGDPVVERVLFRPSGDSVDSEILYTRALYTVSNLGSYFLASEVTSDDQLVGISFRCQAFSHEEAQRILYRGKIARKLKFIESIFNLRLRLPENITPDHVQYIETLFRGVTEGEFVSRGDGVTVFVKAADANLSEAPFSEAGAYAHYLGTEQALLFPQRVLDVGPYYLILKRAVLSDQRLLSSLSDGRDCRVHFEVLDSQIAYRYEKYAQPDKHKRVRRRLDRFHSQLESTEPSELADTLLEPLISDVLPDEAVQIAVGWLQYHNFPDRFSAQDPILAEERTFWRVPIYIVFASGKGAPVGELFINLKTGSIIDEPSPEVMYQEGLVLGEQILRVS